MHVKSGLGCKGNTYRVWWAGCFKSEADVGLMCHIYHSSLSGAINVMLWWLNEDNKTKQSCQPRFTAFSVERQASVFFFKVLHVKVRGSSSWISISPHHPLRDYAQWQIFRPWLTQSQRFLSHWIFSIFAKDASYQNRANIHIQSTFLLTQIMLEGEKLKPEGVCEI